MRAYVFPGFDCLESKELRTLSLNLFQVDKYLVKASCLLKAKYQGHIDLRRFILEDDSIFNHHLDLKIASSVAVQVAIFEEVYHSYHSPDLLVGCSLGDLARSVCAGVASFEDVILGGYEFGRLLKRAQGASILRCSSPIAQRVEDIETLLPEGLYLAVYQTPKHFLIAGCNRKLEAWQQIACHLGYRTAKLAEIPLHSPLMQDAALKMRQTIHSAPLAQQKWPLYSSLWGRLLSTKDCISSEIEQNICNKVDWVQSTKFMIDQLKVTEIVNIGPAPTLLNFCERIPTLNRYKRTDAFMNLFNQRKSHNDFAAVNA